MNFEEALTRTTTSRIKYRYRLPDHHGREDLIKHEVDIAVGGML